MTKIRIYYKGNFSKTIQLNHDQEHYLKRVMRLRDGDKVKIFNEVEGEWLTKLQGKELVKLEKLRESPNRFNRLALAFTPTKGQGDFVVEKAAELNCDLVIPLLTERSVVKSVKRERYEKILLEASEQTGRLDLPRLLDMTAISDLTKVLEGMAKKIIYLVFDPRGQENLTTIKIEEEALLVLLVGPEGGFSEKELEIFPKRFAFGSNILRAETAALVAMTLGNLLLKQD